jgi:hypothetical protein
MRKKRAVYRLLVWTPETNIPTERPRRKWENNI